MTGTLPTIYDLEQPRTQGMPIHPSHRRVGFTYLLHRQHKNTPGDARSGASGTIITSEHAGTHIDALSHQALDHTLNGGIRVTPENETPYGFTVHGIEEVAPIVTRGVMLDVAGSKGVNVLPERYRITIEDLEACCREQSVEVPEGGAVLVRTGYGGLWDRPTEYDRAAGVSVEATEWLIAKKASVVGADNISWEVDDGKTHPNTGTTLPCHVLLLVKNGVYIIENMNLERLAHERTHAFLFICSPLKIVGATGSPVRPIAATDLPL
ncbi:MAG: cyclase family protein [Nitrososphaerota archaeon]|nr:cyclase family protein [Nitrososphaerota archaeon]